LPAPDSSHAVFLSYASQDAQPAQRICGALRAAGIEVWFDQSELRGGDAWDQKIRREIHECALFIPVISANTASRHEGYFRLEWDLADQRTHMMARNRVFIVPVSLDATSEAGVDVPESFQRVQWTRLPAGETSSAFVERVQRLMSTEAFTPTRASAAPGAAPTGEQAPASWWARRALVLMVGVVMATAAVFFAIDRPWVARHAFNPSPHSVAVLPFVNMSGDKDQEYFSDGLSEEILNSLARIDDLQVAASTSAFSFKGKNATIDTIARALNVAAVLEGSVRRSLSTVRITAQLVNTTSGFQIWSGTYDRSLGDVLTLQADVANAVAGALKVRLLGDVAARITLGGTHDPAAFDAYLQASRAYATYSDGKDLQTAIAAYTQAIRLDANYALALAGRSVALSSYAGEFATEGAVHQYFDEARADAEQAITIAPDLAEGHLALARYLDNGSLDFARANQEYEHALALAPGNANIARTYGPFAVWMGRAEAGIAAAQHAVVLDPLNRNTHNNLGLALYYARRYREAIERFQEALALDPRSPFSTSGRGLAYYGLGNLERARSACETKPDYWASQLCLAMTYEKLGRRADAQGMLAKLKAALGDSAAYQYAEISAQWGDVAAGLDWLEKSLQLRDPGLGYLKTDPLLDPLRKDPRFQAIERQLKFPE
jgi:TolB-like protein/Tfp pilus assembly protein PilF